MTQEHPPRRLVLDTNVLVAILVFGDPALEPLRAAWQDGRIVALIDADCRAELQRVLAYPDFAGRAAAATPRVEAFLERCEHVAQAAPSGKPLPQCRDAEDQKFLALASRGRADALLTRDRLLLELARFTPFAIVAPEAVATKLASGVGLDDCLARPAAVG